MTSLSVVVTATNTSGLATTANTVINVSSATAPIFATIPHVLNDWTTQTVLNGKGYIPESSRKSYAAQLSTNTTTPIFRGEVRNGELWTASDGGNDTERAELDGFPTLYNKNVEFWFAYQFKVEPGADQIATSGGNPGGPLAWGAVGQIHGNGTQLAVPWQLSIIGDKLSVRTQQGAQVEKVHWTDTNKLQRNKVYNVVVRIKITGTTASIMTCWIDGVQIANSVNVVISGTDATYYCKVGIYRGWQNDGYPPLAVQIANVEHSTASLLSRVTSPLPWPTVV